jgi:hypothetical protein
MAKRQTPERKGGEGYSDLRLLDAPADLPDGDYVLHLDPIMVSVRRRAGEWLMGNELLNEHKMSQPPTSPSMKA